MIQVKVLKPSGYTNVTNCAFSFLFAIVFRCFCGVMVLFDLLFVCFEQSSAKLSDQALRGATHNPSEKQLPQRKHNI